MFSAASLLINFRTVHFNDAAAKRGAANIDSACTRTALRDFLRGSDFSRISEEVALYDEEIPTGEVIFNPAVLNNFSAKINFNQRQKNGY